MRAKYVGNLPDKFLHTVKNGEVITTIPRGSPLVLSIGVVPNSNDDGLLVVLPSTAGVANTTNLHYGILTSNIAPGDLGETMIFGIAQGIVQKMQRAGSTASWPSAASIPKGPVKIDVASNIFIAGAASDGLSYILLDDIPSAASSASNSGDTRTVINVGARIFVRAL